MSEQDALLPPWRKHPEIPFGSIGWRMGYGEAYMWAWDEWASQLTQAQLIEYFQKQLPIPVEWLAWVSNRFGDENIAKEMYSEEAEFQGIHWLEQQDLANFAEFMAWYESLQ